MSTKSPIYSKLAPLYDTLMGDVDYESWADFIDEIIQTHHDEAVSVLELACGTGSLTLSLAELECYELTGTDQSPEMIEVAKGKATEFEVDAEFFPMDFLKFTTSKTYDVIFSVFDSVNYLKIYDDIITMLNNAHEALNEHGILIFDFSTPQNSIESVDYLNENEGDTGDFRYHRVSRYDHNERIHYNEFEIEELDTTTGKVTNTYFEQHTQRAYSLHEMLSIVEQTPYHLEAKYDGFTLNDATEKSTRVTLVLRCQKTQ